MINEHAQAIEEVIPRSTKAAKDRFSLTWGTHDQISLTRQTSLLWRLSFHEESLPFVKPKIGSPLGNRPHLNFPFRRTRSSTRFCRKRDGSRYFLGTLGWNPNSCPKTSGRRHCKSFIFLDSHWTWHKPYCSKSNVVHSIYMSAHTTSIN